MAKGQKWKDRAAEIQARLTSLRGSIKASKGVDAGKNAMVVGGGAVACGAAKGYDYDEVMGMPIEYAGAAAGVAGWWLSKRTEFLYGAIGFAAPYIAEEVEDRVREYREDNE